MTKWYASKVIWANVLAVIVAVAFVFGVTPNQDTVKTVVEFLSLLMPVINVGLRLITKKPIEGTQPK